MRRVMAALLIGILLMLSFPADAFAAPPGGLPGEAGFSSEQVLVQFRPGVGLPEAARIHSRMGGRVKDTIPGIGVQVVTVPAGQALARARGYASHPLVAYAEPDFVAEALGDPDDPYLWAQWGLHKVEAPAAWDVTTGSSSIGIAILDTGVDPDHPDLAAKVVSSVNFTGSATAADVHGHGTHVAGIAAAITNNGIGVAGIGYDSSIMNVKVLGDDGRGYYSWIAEGIIWAADNGAQVINMSLGGSSASSTLENAVNYAWNQGVVVVAAAGNSGTTSPFYPAGYANCMAVAATDFYDRKTSWSSHGDWVDVAAPGDAIYSTVKGGNYGYNSGTSMASPFVAGLAALVFTVVNDDNGNGRLNDEVRDRIEETCDEIGVSGIGAGRINAFKAVAVEMPDPEPEPEPGVRIALSADPTSISATGDVITYTYTVTNKGEVTLTGVTVTDDLLGTINLEDDELAVDASTTGTASYTVSQDDIDASDDIVTTATVTADQGVTASYSVTVTVDAPEAPVAAVTISPYDQSGRGWVGEQVAYKFTVQNTGNVADTYGISVASDWVSSVAPQTISLEPEAYATITVTHSVPHNVSPGASDSGIVQVLSATTTASAAAAFATTAEEAPEPAPPVIDSFQVTNTSNPAWARATVHWAVSDPDGDLATVEVFMVINGSVVDSATYSVSGDEAGGSCELRHRSRRGTAFGVVIIVTDSLGNTDSQTVSLSS